MSSDYFAYWNVIGVGFAFLGILQVILLYLILRKVD